MASGTPVLASNTPAVAEVAGDAAELFDPKDPDALARSLVRLMDDPGRRAHWARRGRERAERWRWDTAARATLEIYRELVAAAEGVA